MFSSVNPYFPVRAIPAPDSVSTIPAQASASTKTARAIVAETVHEYDGAPYKWGGETASCFDSSGLVVSAYNRVGFELPHQYGKIREHTVEIPADGPSQATSVVPGMWRSISATIDNSRPTALDIRLEFTRFGKNPNIPAGGLICLGKVITGYSIARV